VSQAEQRVKAGEPKMSRRRSVWAPRLRLPPAKIGISKSRVLSGLVLGPCSQEPHQTTYRTSQISTSTYANTYQSVKHSFDSCLPQVVILKYTQYCISMTVDRRFCKVSKGQMDDIKSWESTFGALREHATHHTTPTGCFP